MNKRVALILLSISVFLLASCKQDPFKKNSSIQKEIIENEPKRLKSLETTTLTISFSTTKEDPRVQGLNLFKELVETQTENRIKIKIFGNGQIEEDGPSLTDPQLIQSVISGKLDMTISSAGIYASFIPKAGFTALPYLFTNYEDAWLFLDGDIIADVNSDFRDCNMFVLAQFDNGFRCITTSKEAGPINKVSDMKNLKIRTPQNQVVMETMVALEANPYVSPYATLREDLLNHKFEAQENPIQVIYNSKLYEVQKYLAISNHSYDSVPFTIRYDLWESLKPLDRMIIKDAAIRAQEYNRKQIKQETEDFIKLLEKEGMVVTYPDLKSFHKATQKVPEVFETIYGEELISRIKN